MRTPIMNLDAIGIIRDLSPADLPPNAFSDGRNVAFVDGKVIPQPGYRKLFTPTLKPLFVAPKPLDVDVEAIGQYWIYADLHSIHMFWKASSGDLATEDITRSDGAGGHTTYNAQSVDTKWTSGLYNGIFYMNNGVDIPQYYKLTAGGMANLENFPVSYRCRSLRGFGPYMVALAADVWDNIHRVLWSHPVDPNTIPSSWDIGDPTHDAGDYYLSETSGALIDQLELRGNNIIYKEDAVFRMRFVGGIDIMGFELLEKAGGLLAADCVTTFRSAYGDQHFVFGPDDIYTHDGASVRSVFGQRLRSWIFSNLNPTYYKHSYVRHHKAKKEIWLCFPTLSSQYPDVAVVWNYERDTTSIVDLPGAYTMAVGRIGYDENPPTSALFSDRQDKLLLAAPSTSGDLLEVYDDRSYTYNGTPISVMVERQSLALMGRDDQGKPIPDMSTVKLVTELWPRIEGILGTKIDIYVGSQMLQQEAVKWSGPFTFIVGKDSKINPMVSGRFISVRFKATSVNQWKLNGYDLEIVPAGEY